MEGLDTSPHRDGTPFLMPCSSTKDRPTFGRELTVECPIVGTPIVGKLIVDSQSEHNLERRTTGRLRPTVERSMDEEPFVP
jgi:hypothetical protein